ncbi:hypothetical protein JCM10908_006611 [Rhodotorula pacifica]|uniref:uncharacterized protein n=1 Tax=Rhodotorula pacifica TaxID=1495444 RepID=UPI00316D4B91
MSRAHASAASLLEQKVEPIVALGKQRIDTLEAERRAEVDGQASASTQALENWSQSMLAPHFMTHVSMLDAASVRRQFNAIGLRIASMKLQPILQLTSISREDFRRAIEQIDRLARARLSTLTRLEKHIGAMHAERRQQQLTTWEMKVLTNEHQEDYIARQAIIQGRMDAFAQRIAKMPLDGSFSWQVQRLFRNNTALARQRHERTRRRSPQPPVTRGQPSDKLGLSGLTSSSLRHSQPVFTSSQHASYANFSPLSFFPPQPAWQLDQQHQQSRYSAHPSDSIGAVNPIRTPPLGFLDSSSLAGDFPSKVPEQAHGLALSPQQGFDFTPYVPVHFGTGNPHHNLPSGPSATLLELDQSSLSLHHTVPFSSYDARARNAPHPNHSFPFQSPSEPPSQPRSSVPPVDDEHARKFDQLGWLW